MRKKVKNIVLMLVVGVMLCGCSLTKEDKISIVTTNFPAYDFARSITKGNKKVEVKMLVKPGEEVHTYDPTPQNIIDVTKADMFVFIGGESDDWIENIIGVVDGDKTRVIKLINAVEVKEEEYVDGMEREENKDEKEYDEHVWTSPKNAIEIISKLRDEIIKMDEKNEKLYRENAEVYIKDIEKLDKDFRELVDNSKRKEIIFGDRFPFRYFADEYGLKYYAAFSGCAEETEASAKTISFLVDKVKSDAIPVVFHLELSDEKIADTIVEETGAKKLELHSCHNVSKKDFDSGTTYVDLMKKNLETLREALN